MTSRERVLTAFEHKEPDRVPAWCGSSTEFWEKAKKELMLDDERLRERFFDDFRRVFAKYNGPEIHLSNGATYKTPFGVERTGLGYGQPTEHPLAGASIREINDYPWPDPEWMDVSGIRGDADVHRDKYAILGGDWSPFWHDAIDLVGMETLYYMMFDEPASVDAILNHLVGYYLAVNRKIFDAAGDVIDIFFIGNDFGSQTGPLLGEALFRRFILPHLKKIITLGHDYNLKVMLHCCGGFYPLFPSLIEVGLDGLHAIQPYCKGMELMKLKKEFGKKILLNGCIDSQNVLIKGNPDSVRESTRKVLEIMKPGGGYVAGASHDSILEETPLENVIAMFDAIQEFGKY